MRDSAGHRLRLARSSLDSYMTFREEIWPNANISQLTALVKTRLKRMQYRASLIDGYLAGTGLDLIPSVTLTIKDR